MSKAISERKCAECLQWVHYTGGLYEKCPNCGAFLTEEYFRAAATRVEAEQNNEKKSPFIIREGDSVFLRIGKRTLNIVHLTFMGFVSFILWVVLWLAG